MKFSKWIPHLLVLWIVIIVVVSLIPNLPQPKTKSNGGFFRLDYLFHVFEFFFLALLFFLWQRDRDSALTFVKYLLVFFGVAIFALMTEVVQIWIPGRVYNPVDVVFKVAGFLVGAILYLLGSRLRLVPRTRE